MKYVIIGNSAAAIGCIEGIRSIDKEGSITVISRENWHTYSRPLISYLLLGKTDTERMKYRPDSFYQDNNCTVMLGTTVTKIDTYKKEVLIDSGKIIE
jgi:NAD(P)H-nitrite reductase large subunit